jgi:hypothetical protein
VVLVVIPERLRWNRPWSCASPLARTLVPSWLAASAASATWGYVFAEHFFAGPLAGPSLGVIAVGGLAVAALLVPVYQFMARSCWEYGIEVVLDPKRWGDTRRNLWRELGGAFGAKPSSETAQHAASSPVASGTGTAAAPAEGEEVGG